MPLTEHTLLTWVELNMAMCWVAMPNQVHSLRRDNTRVLASLYKLWDAFQAFLQPTPAKWDTSWSSCSRHLPRGTPSWPSCSWHLPCGTPSHNPSYKRQEDDKSALFGASATQKPSSTDVLKTCWGGDIVEVQTIASFLLSRELLYFSAKPSLTL